MGASIDRLAIQTGFDDGLAAYCEPSNLLDRAMQRSTDISRCDVGEDVREAVALGAEYREAKSAYDQLESRRRSLEAEAERYLRKQSERDVQVRLWEDELRSTATPLARKAELRREIADQRRRMDDDERRIARNEDALRRQAYELERARDELADMEAVVDYARRRARF